MNNVDLLERLRREDYVYLKKQCKHETIIKNIVGLGSIFFVKKFSIDENRKVKVKTVFDKESISITNIVDRLFKEKIIDESYEGISREDFFDIIGTVKEWDVTEAL